MLLCPHPVVDLLASRVLARFQARLAFRRTLVALGVNDLAQLSKMGRSFGVISAYRGNFSKAENQKRHGQLVADLQKLGIRNFHNLKSGWKDDQTGVWHDEKSLFVPHIKFETLHKLGKKYDQDAVLFKDPSGTVGIYHKDGTAEMAYNPEGEPAITPSQKTKKNEPGTEYSRGRSMSFGLQIVPEKFTYSDKAITHDEVVKPVESMKKSEHQDEAETDKWWQAQSPEFKKKYLQEHPGSAFAP